MGVIIGLVVGYAMGAKAGENGLGELKEAWHTIRSSEEARELVSGALTIARGVLSRGGAMLVERLQASGREVASVTTLRPTG